MTTKKMTKKMTTKKKKFFIYDYWETEPFFIYDYDYWETEPFNSKESNIEDSSIGVSESKNLNKPGWFLLFNCQMEEENPSIEFGFFHNILHFSFAQDTRKNQFSFKKPLH